MSVDHPYTLIELLFQGKGLKNVEYLSKSDPFVKVFVQSADKEEFVEVGRTETIDNNLNPSWKNSVGIRYYFEMKQGIRFEIHDEDSATSSKFIGKGECFVGKIMGNKLLNAEIELKDEKGNPSGILLVRAEKVVDSTHHINMKWKAGKVANVDEGYINFWGKSDPYLKFLKIRTDKSTVLVGRTEHIENDVHPSWKPINLPLNRLVVKNEPQSVFKVECWDWDKNQYNHKLIGEAQIKIADLYTFCPEFKLTDPTGKMQNPGNLILENIEFIQVPSWVDHIRSGLQLNLSVAVDLSLSNKPFTDPTSLHHISNHKNDYQRVLKSFWDIIRNYDEDDKIFSFGFGAKPHFQKLNQNTVNHCFSLTGHSQAMHIKGFDDFMDSYVYALKNVEPGEPTYLCPVLETCFQLAKKQQSQNVYQILLILTDGQVDDVNETIKLLVGNCKLPISIIIVGIGSGDFSKMAKYDADNGLFDANQQPIQRDFVQFVPFNKYKNNETVFTSEILAEIPEQISRYMVMSGKVPVVKTEGLKK